MALFLIPYSVAYLRLYKFAVKYRDRAYTVRQIMAYTGIPSESYFKKLKYILKLQYGIEYKYIGKSATGKSVYRVIEHPVESLVKFYYYRHAPGRRGYDDYSIATVEWEVKMALRRSEVDVVMLQEMMDTYVNQVEFFERDREQYGQTFTAGVMFGNRIMPENSMTDIAISRIFEDDTNMRAFPRENMLFTPGYHRVMDDKPIEQVWTYSVDIDDIQKDDINPRVFNYNKWIAVYERGNKFGRKTSRHYIMQVKPETIKKMLNAAMLRLVNDDRSKFATRQVMNDDPYRLALDRERQRGQRFANYAKGVLFDIKAGGKGPVMKGQIWHRIYELK